ncbi:dynamin family protein [Roseobacter sinensis]|uniref:Dynamin family protein n=1 Tax=Roseobacter sinensis TaxID=2931391 RepID=A0ABT3BHS0_9RHOB|nr:dynamin family protein [Roseobacter sp. WL0113]MCV3273123.1 dynamin family protein [Roseobacter sp. WL0113]
MTPDETVPAAAAFARALTGPRRPRIALMGEFSAGKSTLANLMIGADPLPVQVIATQLPPVWISHGTAPAAIVDLEGSEAPCDLETLQEAAAEDTAFIRIQCEEDILQMCDIIDMPGISDPNMPSEVWERILPLADAVIWCSPSTQAWRQSEASVWAMVPEHVRAQSLLLLTRGDMLHSEKDRRKVLRRVQGETEGLFRDTLMISLTQARDAEDDPQQWEESGAEPFVNAFLDVVATVAAQVSDEAPNAAFDRLAPSPEPAAEPQETAPPDTSDRIVPRRPVAKPGRARSTPRPQPMPEDDLSLTPKFS